MSSRKAVTSFSMHSIRHLLVLSSLCCFISANGSETDRSRAHELMTTYPLIDAHNDIATSLRAYYNNNLSEIDLHNLSHLTTDISRLQAGHVQTQMFAAFVLCPAQDKDAVRLTLEQIDVIRRMCTEYQQFELVTSPEELENAEKRRKIACLISIEGGHSIDSSLPTLRMFYRLGVRSMTITHNCNTPWAKSSSMLYSFYQSLTNSLTSFGKAVVEEMNRLGMIVDISHTSWGTASAVLKHTKAPVIFSHSSSYFICSSQRNVPDILLHKLKKNGGLIMVNFHNNFVSCEDKANISHVADHFDHIKKVIGAESIGFGADFEGAPTFPQGLDDVSKYPDLIQELLQRNWTENDLANVLRRNFLRVFREVERVRDELNVTLPGETQIPAKGIQNSCRLNLTLAKKLQQSPISRLTSGLTFSLISSPNSSRTSSPKSSRTSSPKSSRTSRAQHGAADLLILATVLLLSSMFID
ncbi:dipeptidase 2 [Hippoglossus hippoglossus]|uniref:dipeptidase 2 n=1 Tax=Hippoglossus hippoglossus TaxID=8267 RepID=UPI00148DD821|nr:dipeptidase 2 [Hippoglossus hippoglossus]